MKRKVVLIAIVIACLLGLGLCLLSWAFGGPAPEKKEEVKEMKEIFIVSDFESGSIKSPREWWTFDISQAEAASNENLTKGNQDIAAKVGNYSFHLSGGATNWYAGGCGTYIAEEGQDLSKYNFFQLDIYGNGAGSGTLKIEIFDDDNNNWQVEQDPAKSYAPVHDDKLVYEVSVDWNGWERVSIPLDDFVDDNPKVGDDIWNPQQSDGSGGFLQIQIICLATSDKGSVDYNLDNISLTVSEE